MATLSDVLKKKHEAERHMRARAISVAAFAKDASIRSAISASDSLRQNTLNKCDSIPGYKNLTSKEKTAIYDIIRSSLLKEQGV